MPTRPPIERRVLSVLRRHPGRPFTLAELATALEVSESSVSRAIIPLTRARFIHRRRDPGRGTYTTVWYDGTRPPPMPEPGPTIAQRVLATLAANPTRRWSARELADTLGADRRVVTVKIHHLARAGRLERTPECKGRPLQTWHKAN